MVQTTTTQSNKASWERRGHAQFTDREKALTFWRACITRYGSEAIATRTEYDDLTDSDLLRCDLRLYHIFLATHPYQSAENAYSYTMHDWSLHAGYNVGCLSMAIEDSRYYNA